MSQSASHKPDHSVRVIVYKDGAEWVAHCLEMDIVATAKTQKQVSIDIIKLVIAQVDFAIAHDNIVNIFKSAPSEAWAKYYTATRRCRREAFRDDAAERDYPFTGAELCFG